MSVRNFYLPRLVNYELLSFQPSSRGRESVVWICRTSKLKIKIALKTLTSDTAFQGAAPSSRSLTSPHFYSLSERACRNPLKVQVTKTIRMPRFFEAQLKQTPFHYPLEWELCHFCLPQQAKVGQNSCILPHMISIGICRNKTVTGTQ